MSSDQRIALIAGATGLVGGFLLQRLLDQPLYREVISLVRRPTGNDHAKLRELVVDFDRLEDDACNLAADDVYCCLGTTIKKAGSQEAFRKVDQVYVETLARVTRGQGAQRLTLISSIGADSSVKNFYLSVKGATEEAVATYGFPELHILRPSLLLGERSESRPAERAASFASKLGAPLLLGPWRPYRPVQAREVAAAMLGAATRGTPGHHVYFFDDIERLGNG